MPSSSLATSSLSAPSLALTADDADDRPMWPALRKGWCRRCPNCGSGPLLRSYLKVRDNCAVCGTDFTPQRADDGPAYLTILIVGHLLAPILMFVFVKYRPEPILMFTGFAIGTVALSLYLLPRLKGVLIAMQWSKRMHGFGHTDTTDHSND